MTGEHDKTKKEVEKAAGDVLVKWYNERNGTVYSFSHFGSDPPDLVYVDPSRGVLGVEVTTAYYDNEHAKLLWLHARDKPNAPRQWQGVNPDDGLRESIQKAIQKKCDQGPSGCCLLGVRVTAACTTIDDLQGILHDLTIPQETPFHGLYLVASLGRELGSGPEPEYRVFDLSALGSLGNPARAGSSQQKQPGSLPKLPLASRFRGRKVVDSYDPASWPCPREEDAEREWDEAEE